jgi:hypothetical protein
VIRLIENIQTNSGGGGGGRKDVIPLVYVLNTPFDGFKKINRNK